MSKIIKTVQHKEKRDKANAKELADLKKQNHSLKRTVARLNKQINKLMDSNSGPEAEDEMTTTAISGPVCPACASTDIRTLKLSNFTLTVCKSCDFKIKTKKEDLID